MTQSRTITASQTFTIADARYLASRIATDLSQVRLHYGHFTGGYLTEQKVSDLAVEAAVLLKFGLLDNVKYGFQRDGNWVFAISYTVNSQGQLEVPNDAPGSIYSQADLTGTSWHSYLTQRYNPDVSTEDKKGIEESLPIQRTSGQEPGTAGGSWDNDKTYYKNGTSVQRGQFRSL